jgi:hypothetical protein
MAPALNGVFRAWDAKEAVRGVVTLTQQHLETTRKAYTKEVECYDRHRDSDRKGVGPIGPC